MLIARILVCKFVMLRNKTLRLGERAKSNPKRNLAARFEWEGWKGAHVFSMCCYIWVFFQMFQYNFRDSTCGYRKRSAVWRELSGV